MHLAPGGRNEFIRIHLPGHFSPFSIQEGGWYEGGLKRWEQDKSGDVEAKRRAFISICPLYTLFNGS